MLTIILLFLKKVKEAKKSCCNLGKDLSKYKKSNLNPGGQDE